jgi:hypothetical protein
MPKDSLTPGRGYFFWYGSRGGYRCLLDGGVANILCYFCISKIYQVWD